MIIVTTDTIPGKRVVKTLGLVKGNTIRARHVGKDILAGLKGLVGGEIAEYTKMVAESREQCLDRLTEEAEKFIRVCGEAKEIALPSACNEAKKRKRRGILLLGELLRPSPADGRAVRARHVDAAGSVVDRDTAADSLHGDASDVRASGNKDHPSAHPSSRRATEGASRRGGRAGPGHHVTRVARYRAGCHRGG